MPYPHLIDTVQSIGQAKGIVLLLKIQLNSQITLVNCELKLEFYPAVTDAIFAVQYLVHLGWDVVEVVVNVQDLDVAIYEPSVRYLTCRCLNSPVGGCHLDV